MDGGAAWKVGRAVVIGLAALAVTSVVLWPVAVVLLPLLFWAACGGRVARWSASIVAAVVVFVAAEIAVWGLVRWATGVPPANRWWMVGVAVVVPMTLAAFLWGSRRVADRRVVGPTAPPGRATPIVA